MGGLGRVAFALTLAGLAGTLLAVALLWRLRQDFRELDAADRFEAAHVSRVVQRYVPLELRTRIVGEEMAIARQFMGAMWPRWRRIAVLSGVIMLCGATAAYVAVRRNQTAVAVARSVARPALNLEKPAPNPEKPARACSEPRKARGDPRRAQDRSGRLGMAGRRAGIRVRKTRRRFP